MSNRLAGLILVFSAISFWLAWLLMPDAGTNDAAHILEVVRTNRTAVWWSVVVQIVSSVAFVPAILGLQTGLSGQRPMTTQVGAMLVLIGAMGMCADAFFHLAAYYMTAEGVPTAAVLEPMRLLQTEGIRLLVPLLLPFFVGGWVYARGLRKASLVSHWPERVFAAAFALAALGAAAAAGLGVDRHLVVLSFLGVIALGYVWIGLEQIAGRPVVQAAAEGSIGDPIPYSPRESQVTARESPGARATCTGRLRILLTLCLPPPVPCIPAAADCRETLP